VFKFKKPDHKPTVEQKLIADLYTKLAGYEPDSEEFKKALDGIDSVQKQIQIDKKLRSRWTMPSSDAILTGAVSLLGIVLILHYEKLDVVSSKALGFVHKPKI